MKGNRSSEGFTFIGFAMLAVLLIIVVLIIFRVAPAYIENYSVSNSLGLLQSKLDERSSNGALQRRAIQKALDRLFDVNGIRSVTARDAKVTRAKQGFKVRVNYDVNVDLVGNVSLIIHFDDTVIIKENVS